jgi:hypothetical protein
MVASGAKVEGLGEDADADADAAAGVVAGAEAGASAKAEVMRPMVKHVNRIGRMCIFLR